MEVNNFITLIRMTDEGEIDVNKLENLPAEEINIEEDCESCVL